VRRGTNQSQQRPLAPALLMLASCLHAGLTHAATLPAGYTEQQLDAAIEQAKSQGTMLYKHDRAIAIATRALMEFREARGDRRLAGPITEEKEDGAIVVTFVGGPPGEVPRALYRVNFGKEGKAGKPLRYKTSEALTEFEAAAAAARRFALSTTYESCSERYTTIVLPSESGADRSWTVFLLPAPTKPNVVPMGGTHRLELDWNAERVISTRSFAKACAEVPYNSSMAAVFVAHALDPVPTEAHVLWNLQIGVPLIVDTKTDDLLWAIEKGAIRQMGDGKPKR
jgi:hypothetical protein